jgi:hypothetical protein
MPKRPSRFQYLPFLRRISLITGNFFSFKEDICAVNGERK